MKILYICGRHPKSKNQTNGGACRHTALYMEALWTVGIEGIAFDRTAYLDETTRKQINDKMRDYDVIHCDDTQCLDAMLAYGIIPDITGPHTRSPMKFYKDLHSDLLLQTIYVGYNNNNTTDIYDDIQWVRFNHQDEPQFLWNKLELIKCCVDAHSPDLFPSNKKKKYVMWAGTPDRWAKDYDRWLKIREYLTGISPYEVIELLDYKLEDYYKALDECALLVHTGRYESWCFQLHEAWAKEVLTIHKRGLWGDTYDGCGLFCFGQDDLPKTIADHIKGILELSDKHREFIGRQSREKILKDCLPVHYGNRWRSIYERTIERKKNGDNHRLHKPT